LARQDRFSAISSLLQFSLSLLSKRYLSSQAQRLKTWPLPKVLQRIKELKDWIDGSVSLAVNPRSRQPFLILSGYSKRETF